MILHNSRNIPEELYTIIIFLMISFTFFMIYFCIDKELPPKYKVGDCFVYDFSDKEFEDPKDPLVHRVDAVGKLNYLTKILGTVKYKNRYPKQNKLKCEYANSNTLCLLKNIKDNDKFTKKISCD